MVFFAYVAVISRAGFVGALRIAYYELLPRIGRERLEVERRKIRALGERGKSPPTPR